MNFRLDDELPRCAGKGGDKGHKFAKECADTTLPHDGKQHEEISQDHRQQVIPYPRLPEHIQKCARRQCTGQPVRIEKAAGNAALNGRRTAFVHKPHQHRRYQHHQQRNGIYKRALHRHRAARDVRRNEKIHKSGNDEQQSKKVTVGDADAADIGSLGQKIIHHERHCREIDLQNDTCHLFRHLPSPPFPFSISFWVLPYSPCCF